MDSIVQRAEPDEGDVGTPPPRKTAGQSEISIFQFLGVLWRRKFIVAASVAVFAALGFVYLLNATPSYTARMLVAPVEDQGPRGGLTSLIGSTLGAPFLSAGAGMDRYLEKIVTPSIAQRMQDRYQLMQVLYAEEWDAATSTWHPPANPSFVVRLRNALRDVLGLPSWAPPNAVRLADSLDRMISVTPQQAIGFYEMSIQHRDPAFAVWLLGALHEEIQRALREETTQSSSAKSNYILDKLKQVMVSEHRNALSTLLIYEQQKQILADLGQPLVAEIYEPPTVSVLPTSPRIVFTIAVAVVFGLFAGILLAIAHYAWRKEKAERGAEPVLRKSS